MRWLSNRVAGHGCGPFWTTCCHFDAQRAVVALVLGELDMLPVAAPLDIDVAEADAGFAPLPQPQADALVDDAAVARRLVQGVGQYFGRCQHIVDEPELAQSLELEVSQSKEGRR